jgi:UDP-N-acetylmuramoyl-tripeptide--D-alanyl-D-alanine ligase
LKPGSLYVAIKGDRFDGHAFVNDAAAKGAAAAMVSDSTTLQPSAGCALLCVEDTRVALGRLAKEYARKVGARMVAVTGSAGKSTVKEMTAQVLAAGLPTAWTIGNLNNDIGLPLSLLAMAPDTRMGVFEAGSNHPGEIDGLCRLLKPDWGIITNVGPVHIEHFGTVEAIAREKGSLLTHLPTEGRAVLQQDGAFFRYLSSLCTCPVTTISLEDGADYVCLNNDFSGGELLVEETASGERYKLPCPLPGEHNVLNAMFAVAVGRLNGLAWETISLALAGYKPMPMRWEEVRVGGVRVVNDAYNANPLSMRASLKTFAEKDVPGRKWLVLSGMLELGAYEASEHRLLGRILAAGPWSGVITVGPLGAFIAEGACQAGFQMDRLFRCASNPEAVDILQQHLTAGDAVLLKASRGMRLEQVLDGLKRTGGVT